jgi:hypothetical protein
VEPYITLQGSAGTAVFHYTEDRLTVTTKQGQAETTYGRDDLTVNLVSHRTAGARLISPIVDSGAFMLVLEAIRTAPAPAAIAPEFVRWEGDGDDAHAVVVGIEEALERATQEHALFSELGLPWAGQ